MKKKILVLGSSGQIGLHLCNYLKNKKYFVEKFDICVGKKFDLRKYNILRTIRKIYKEM